MVCITQSRVPHHRSRRTSTHAHQRESATHILAGGLDSIAYSCRSSLLQKGFIIWGEKWAAFNHRTSCTLKAISCSDFNNCQSHQMRVQWRPVPANLLLRRVCAKTSPTASCLQQVSAPGSLPTSQSCSCRRTWCTWLRGMMKVELGPKGTVSGMPGASPEPKEVGFGE